MRVALVTEELAVYGNSGGIGAAMFELGVSLASNGFEVDIYYFPLEAFSSERRATTILALLERGIKLNFVDASHYVWDVHDLKNRSYSAYCALRDSNTAYDFIHFHDYKGLGFYACNAKSQGIAFEASTLVVQLHGPLRWTLHANRSLFTHSDQLLSDYLERESIRLADEVVSPSYYLIDWLRKEGFVFPPPERVQVIKNICSFTKPKSRRRKIGERTDIREIIFFGRHEPRKGIVTFSDALDIAEPLLRAKGISVTFVGALGEINGVASGVYLSDRSRKWGFPIRALIGLNRLEAISFLSSRASALVVIPSSEENSPYTVIEAVTAGCPIVTSAHGGARELIDDEFHNEAVVNVEPETLAERIMTLIENGVRIPRLAEETTLTASKWTAFHSVSKLTTPKQVIPTYDPKVVVGITHFERPGKVVGAILSVLRQTYQNIEIVVVDDGSKSSATVAALNEISSLLNKVGGRLIVRENGYLGAARNTVAEHTSSDYILFLDDDDLLLPDAVAKLVKVAVNTDADIVNCLNIYMEADNRSQYEIAPEKHGKKASYVPTGGPMSLAHVANNFGGATALIKRSFFTTIGGYSELKRVGFEDYELFLKAVQAGGNLRILPEPLYLYEIGKPSMVSGTSRMANQRRVVEAIDVKMMPDQWHDAIELASGQAALADQIAATAWRMSNSKHKHHLEKVMETRCDAPAHLAALIDYSIAIDSPAATMWAGALNKPTTISSEHNSVNTRLPALTSQPELNILHAFDIPNFSKMAVSWKLGRFDDVADELVAQIKESGEVAEPAIDFAFLIAGSKSLSAEAAARLAEQLGKGMVDTSLAVKLDGAIVSLELAAHRKQNAKMRLERIVLAESAIYQAANSDVASAYGEGPADRVFDHYRRWGKAEGRSGFDILQRVAKTFGERRDEEFASWQLYYEFDELVETGDSSVRDA